MNKQGQVKEFVLFLYKFFFLGIAVLGFVLLVGLLLVNNLSTQQLEHEIFFQRVLYSGESITYQDPVTGRYYTSLIDTEKINNTHLDEYLNYTFKFKAAAKINISYLNESPPKQGPIAYMNEKQYTQWKIREDSGFFGLGSATSTINRYAVTAINSSTNEQTPALLQITYITPGKKQ